MTVLIQDIPNYFDRYLANKKATNALAKQELENQYYAPNIKSEINQRNAITEGQNIHNKYLPEEYRVANALNQQKYEWNPRNWESENANRNALTKKYNTMTPLEAEELRIKNRFAPETIQADIDSKKAIANWRRSGGFGGMGVDQKAAQGFNQQLAKDHPDWTPEQINDASNAYYEGRNTFSDGTDLPPLSGQAEDIFTKIHNKNAPVAVRNQAANYDVLTRDLEDFDIDAVKAMAGAQGKAKLAYAKAKMLTNPNDPSIDPMARRFLASMNQAILNMDSMRKAFGTSVVPDYVYNTIGRLTNPSDSIFNDATQIENNYKSVVRQIKKNRDLLMEKAKKGVTAAPKESENIQKWGRDANGRPIRI